MFIDLPSRRKAGWRWATPLLCALSGLAFLWLNIASDEDAFARLLLRWGTLSGDVLHWRAALSDVRLFTLGTALFIHVNALHLAGNLVFLLIFGLPTERAIGSPRLLLLFLAGGSLANLVAALVLGGPGHLIVGASGGVSAIIGAYLALFPGARLGIVIPLGLWLEFVRAPAALLIGLWAGLQLLFTFIGPVFGSVAWWAHLTGFVIGVVAALLLRPVVARNARRR
jgi:membrane associated rhomboid family serine protease